MVANERVEGPCRPFSRVSSRSLGLSEGVRSRRVRSLEEVAHSKQVRCEKEVPGTGMGMDRLLGSSRWEVELPAYATPAIVAPAKAPTPIPTHVAVAVPAAAAPIAPPAKAPNSAPAANRNITILIEEYTRLFD